VSTTPTNISRSLSSGRKPELVCIGAQKAGTSWLFEVLSDRPDIYTPPFKELHFFDHKFIKECNQWAGWHVKKEIKNAKKKHLDQNIDPDQKFLDYLDSILQPPMFNGNWYKNIFSPAPSSSICLDVTPEYSCLPEEGVRFVAKFLKETKFIFIIRNPLDRAMSQLRMNISRKGIPSTKEEWVSCAKLSIIYSRGDYETYIPRWCRYFSQDRILFLPFSEIANNPLGLLREIERFAQLKPYTHYKKAAKIIHKTKFINVPDYINLLLSEKLQDQNEFLKAHFSSEFYSKI
jgi:hypothetical protein